MIEVTISWTVDSDR